MAEALLCNGQTLSEHLAEFKAAGLCAALIPSRFTNARARGVRVPCAATLPCKRHAVILYCEKCPYEVSYGENSIPSLKWGATFSPELDSHRPPNLQRNGYHCPKCKTFCLRIRR